MLTCTSAMGGGCAWVLCLYLVNMYAHKVAITLEACHVREVIEQAFARWSTPEIVNTDHGTQFTATEFTDVVLGHGCQLSMDGRGAWHNDGFVERLWRSVSLGRVYLKAYDGVSAARADIADYMGWYNSVRAHSRLGDHTPDEHYFAHLPALALAASDEIAGAPRVAHRVGRFVASADRRRGHLCTVCNPLALHS